MSSYYSKTLNAEKLELCYEIAPQRVQQYLQEEINYVLERVSATDIVLDLGCGYGRIIPQLKQKARSVVGIDISLNNLIYGLPNVYNCNVSNMNAINLGFRDHVFDLVICIQNGISAFQVNKRRLIQETIRITKPGGKIFYSTYSDKFWKHRFNWFELQSEVGLLGEINYQKSKDGKIICKDGFKATTITPKRFLSIVKGLSIDVKISEIDESSLFYEISA
ncbi:MAG: class I SAM-dependent methyltransferase [Candidatus Heimdallarchaeota archaeon]